MRKAAWLVPGRIGRTWAVKAFQGAVQHGQRLGRGKDRMGGVEEGVGGRRQAAWKMRLGWGVEGLKGPERRVLRHLGPRCVRDDAFCPAASHCADWSLPPRQMHGQKSKSSRKHRGCSASLALHFFMTSHFRISLSPLHAWDPGWGWGHRAPRP